MKIAISSMGKDLESNLDLRFGRAEYFIIYDLEKDDFQAIDNKGFTARGGAGIATSQELIDQAVNVVISGNFGPNAYDLLKDGEIKMFKGEKMSVKDIIQEFKNDKLQEVKSAGPSRKGGN